MSAMCQKQTFGTYIFTKGYVPKPHMFISR
jgi:hypothetical protein